MRPSYSYDGNLFTGKTYIETSPLLSTCYMVTRLIAVSFDT